MIKKLFSYVANHWKYIPLFKWKVFFLYFILRRLTIVARNGYIQFPMGVHVFAKTFEKKKTMKNKNMNL